MRLCLALLWALFASSAWAEKPITDVALRKLILDNAGKFNSEAKLPPLITLRAPVPDHFFAGVRYSDSQQHLHSEFGISLGSTTLWWRCEATGSFTGQNAFGRKVRVTTRRCEHVEISPHTSFKLGSRVCEAPQTQPADQGAAPCREYRHELKIPLSAAQYRQMKIGGFKFEIDFAPGGLDGEPVAEVDRRRTTAKIDYPYEDALATLSLHGVIKAVRLIAPGGELVVAFDADS